MCSNYQHANTESSGFTISMRHSSFKRPSSHSSPPSSRTKHWIIPPQSAQPTGSNKPLKLHPSPPPKNYRLPYPPSHSSPTTNRLLNQSLSPPIPQSNNLAFLSNHVLSLPTQPYRPQNGNARPISLPLPLPQPLVRAGPENLPSHSCPSHGQRARKSDQGEESTQPRPGRSDRRRTYVLEERVSRTVCGTGVSDMSW